MSYLRPDDDWSFADQHDDRDRAAGLHTWEQDQAAERDHQDLWPRLVPLDGTGPLVLRRDRFPRSTT